MNNSFICRAVPERYTEVKIMGWAQKVILAIFKKEKKINIGHSITLSEIKE
jgi:hypothetical protein